MSGCRFNLSINDEELSSGIDLLKGFISATCKIRSSRNINVNKVAEIVVKKLSDENYVFLSSVDTFAKTNVLDAWESFKEESKQWLRNVITSYCFDSYIEDLPDDYKAKIAFELVVLLVKDVIENRLNEVSAEIKKSLLQEPVITWMGKSLTLYDIVGLLYPSALSLLTSGIISFGTEPIRLTSHYSGNIKALHEKTSQAGKRGGSPYRIYKLLYLPLTLTGLASEFSVPAIEQELGGYKYRFAITGMGHNFLNSMAFVLSQSFNRIYYEYVLNNLIGISHAFKIFIQYYLRNIFSVDEFSVAKGVIDEYLKYMKGRDAGLSRYFSYNISDAMKDIAMATLTLLNQYYELQAQGIASAYVNRYAEYLPTIVLNKPVNEVIKTAVKRFWLYSQV